jgi:NADPH2:quinone reductase
MTIFHKNTSIMKAIQLIKNGNAENAFAIKEMQIPKPKGYEICIKVSAFGLNFADVMARQGLYRDCPPLPAVIGYDVEGIVHSIGEKVEGYKNGDRVFGMTRFGGYAEYAVTDSRAVGKLSSDAPIGEGTALATQYGTAYYAAEIVQTLIPGEVVLIHAAAGGVGTALIQLCKRRGCKIIGTAGSEKKISYLKDLGVDYPINYRVKDFEKETKKIIGERSLSAYFDNLGGKSIKIGKKLLMPGGRILSYGAASMSGRKSTLNLLKLAYGFGLFSPISYLQSSQAFNGINMLRIADHKPDLMALIMKGVSELYAKNEINPTIGKVFHASEIADAHTYLESRKSIGKIAIQWAQQ